MNVQVNDRNPIFERHTPERESGGRNFEHHAGFQVQVGGAGPAAVMRRPRFVRGCQGVTPFWGIPAAPAY
jgi:hypothetical protein